MSEKRRDSDCLADIREAIKRILSYTAGLTWQGFLKDSKTQDAVVRNLEVIGGATKNRSAELRKAHPDIPWKEQIVTENLPGLLPRLDTVVAKQ